MESEVFSPTIDAIKCCDCGCSCSLINGSSSDWIRTVKRKYGEFEEGNKFYMPGFDLFSNAKVQVENECIALRETLSSQQQSIQDLYAELEEERNAASSAANEAMSMILRLQREKAEIQMEFRQFKMFVEEKMAHDNQVGLELEDILYKREQEIQSITCEMQAYKHRMLSFGLTEEDVEGEKNMFSRYPSLDEIDAPYDLPVYDYPQLRCNLNEIPGYLDGDNDVAEIGTYPSADSPTGRNQLKTLERRIIQMERNQSNIVVQSPGRQRQRKPSIDSLSSPFETTKDIRSEFFVESPRIGSSSKKIQSEDQTQARNVDNASDMGDDMSDRVYTIDSVAYKGTKEDKTEMQVNYEDETNGKEKQNQSDLSDPDVKKLYMRLQALEADRESMRDALISMRTEKTQLLLLKEIAQHLSKEIVPERPMPGQKPSIIGVLSFMPVFKWIASLVSWRKKARRSKYMYGLSGNNSGLLMLLDKGPQLRQWRCLTSTQV